jgi:GNAT superfamily N-acetyltransferase
MQVFAALASMALGLAILAVVGTCSDDNGAALDAAWRAAAPDLPPVSDRFTLEQVLSDGVLHALIVNVIVTPEMRGHGIGTEIMTRLVARCQEEGVLQVQLFSARGKSGFYEHLGFVARPDDGPGMELGGQRQTEKRQPTRPRRRRTSWLAKAGQAINEREVA